MKNLLTTISVFAALVSASAQATNVQDQLAKDSFDALQNEIQQMRSVVVTEVAKQTVINLQGSFTTTQDSELIAMSSEDTQAANAE